MKTCSGCKLEKPVDQFSRDRRYHDRRMARCKSCRQAALAEWRKASDYDRVRYWRNPASERERHLIRKYGVTLAQYDPAARARRDRPGR